MAKSTRDTADDDWRARSDASTLAEALEIQGDAKRMAAARKAAKERLDELAAVVDRHKLVVAGQDAKSAKAKSRKPDDGPSIAINRRAP